MFSKDINRRIGVVITEVTINVTMNIESNMNIESIDECENDDER
jgi:hypothetical protein